MKTFGKKVLIIATAIIMVVMLAMTLAACNATGEKGDKGDKGDQGIQGEQGLPGQDGAQGEAGKDGVDATVRPEYNFYITGGTLPTLYAYLNTYLDSTESYMWLTRPTTFDATKVPSNVKKVWRDNQAGAADVVVPGTEYDNEGTALRGTIADILEEHPDAFFNFFCDDLKAQIEITVILNAGIKDGNYSLTLYNDGVGSYTNFEALYAPANGIDNFNVIKNTYNQAYDKVMSGVPYGGLSSDPDSMELGKTDKGTLSYYIAQKSYVKYIMQFPESLKSLSAEMNIELGYANLIKRSPQQMYKSLSRAKQKAFLSTIIDTEFFDNMFASTNGKPNLILSGGSTTTEQNNYQDVYKKVVADYGETYNIFYKPHPKYPPTGDRKAFIEGLDITIMPAALPMEVIMWAYPELKIGGWKSSLYMSMDKYQTVFLIAINSEVNNLAPPLGQLYEDGFFVNAAGEKIPLIDANYIEPAEPPVQ